MKAHRLLSLLVISLLIATNACAQTILYPTEDREIEQHYDGDLERVILGDGQWWPHVQWVEGPPYENRVIVYFDLSLVPAFGDAFFHFYAWRTSGINTLAVEVWYFEDDGTVSLDDFDPGAAELVDTYTWENPTPDNLQADINAHVRIDVTEMLTNRTQDRIGLMLRLAGGYPDFDGNVFHTGDGGHYLEMAAVENTEQDGQLKPALELHEPADPDRWSMKQRDPQHTGRADFTIPDDRKSNLFDLPLWQTPSPGSPGEGGFTATSMAFVDAAGPENTDIVVGTYHWPKGIMGMDRHTGKTFWSGNPDGGEYIGHITPGFSPDGSTIYVVNDGPPGPLMAMTSTEGPSWYWDNSGQADPWHMQKGSPLVTPDGRIFCFAWCDRAYGAEDSGSALTDVWAAENPLCPCFSEPAWHVFEDGSGVIVVGRHNAIRRYDDATGLQVWSVEPLPQGTDASATIDPETGNIYVPLGMDSIYIAGLDPNGVPLWSEPALRLYEFIDGTNHRQRAMSAGCLSHDGATYYFQTVSQEATGQLFAVNTADGSTKWVVDTASSGWEADSSCPIVTPNHIVIVGNNDGRRYYAVEDLGQGSYAVVDTLDTADGGNARAGATLSKEGLLYLPVRTTWTAANGNGQTPDFSVQNLFTAFDLRAEASVELYPPGDQTAVALNHAVLLKWKALQTSTSFAYYAIYRSESPFDSVAGMTPIDTQGDYSANSYTDTSADNGISYYYAVTTVSITGGEFKQIASIGPRTPRDETDLQMLSIARTPFYPRYCPTYTYHEITEPSGFGPYSFSSATGLGCGQTPETRHWPEPNELMTYTASVRNRGTNPISGTLNGTWTLSGKVHSQPSQLIDLQPGETAQFVIELVWDNDPHELTFAFDLTDDRPENNSLTSDTLAVGFLTYIDRSFVEQFREEWSPNWPDCRTDDVIDWLNMHMDRFNELFEEADCDKRVHYDVLQVIDDAADDPEEPAAINFAIFPFRYRAGVDFDPRTSGYYHTDDDIDYGLLHEMGHQLGMIDLYQLDLASTQNEVSGQGYFGSFGLMHGCSPYISEFHAHAMNQWLRSPHGYYGQFLYHLPRTVQLRLLGYDGTPLDGATVTVYQSCERPGIGEILTSQIKAQGTTDSEGLYTLPTVPIDPNLVPATPMGDTLGANAFGYVHVVGTNAVFLIRVEYNGGIDYAWLDVTEACNAFWNGQTDSAVFERLLSVGGPLMQIMPLDLAENNAADWEAWADSSNELSTYIIDDTLHTHDGSASVHFVTDGGFDTYVRYPDTYTAQWNLTDATELRFWVYAENNNGFQSGSPWIRLRDAEGHYFEYQYVINHDPADWLNDARGQWQLAQIPLDAPADPEFGWRRTIHGTPDLAAIGSLEFHADTWDYGFELWLDEIAFDWPAWKYRDFVTDGQQDLSDLAVLAAHWLRLDCTFTDCGGADLTQDHTVTLTDVADFSRTWMMIP